MKKIFLLSCLALTFACATSLEASPQKNVPEKFDFTTVAAPALAEVIACTPFAEVTGSVSFTAADFSTCVIVFYSDTTMTVDTYFDSGGAAVSITLPALYPAYTSDPDISKWSIWKDKQHNVSKQLQNDYPLIT